MRAKSTLLFRLFAGLFSNSLATTGLQSQPFRHTNQICSSFPINKEMNTTFADLKKGSPTANRSKRKTSKVFFSPGTPVDIFGSYRRANFRKPKFKKQPGKSNRLVTI